MNMASIEILFLLLIFIRVQSTSEEKVFVKVECKTSNKGQYGQQSMLECVIQTTQNVKDPKIQVVTWEKKGSERTLLTYYNKTTEALPGYSFAEPSWNDRNMNISLLITNTVPNDNGDYICMVITDSGIATQFTSLNVTAKYSKPTIYSIPEKITGDEDVTLSCNSEGYPQGQLTWLDEHNKTWEGKTAVETTDNGLFKLSSNLSLLKNSIFSKYTCVVFNPSDNKEEKTTLEIQAKLLSVADNEAGERFLSSKIVAPVVVIGSLIIGLLLALLFYRRRSAHSPDNQYI
ncbi:hypothetical protein PAMP_020901 [Pampus punctatissimus]